MKQLKFILIALCLMMMTACEHKDFCYDHGGHQERIEYEINLNYDRSWEYGIDGNNYWLNHWQPVWGLDYDAIRPAEPEGARVHIYYNDEMESERNLRKKGSSVFFQNEGYYDMLFYNNDTEYILFEGTTRFTTAYATTRSLVRSTYRGNSKITRGTKETTMTPPDMLYGAYIDSFEVKKSVETQTLDVTLHPLVYTYLIRFEVSKGAEHIRQAKGAFAGMAKGVNLYDGRTSNEVATVMFDCETIGDFGVQTLVKSFGIPDYPNPHYTRGDRQYGVSLEMLLKNGNFQQHDFDVTEQVENQPTGGVIVIKGIEIDETRDESKGFIIGVDGWGDVVDVPLPL